MDCLIVIDDVSGVADNCKKLAAFLTVCRKYKYHRIYFFHIIAPETQIWKKNYLKQIFLIFSLWAYLTILYQKYHKVTVDKHEKIFWHVLCGYIGSLRTLLIQTNESLSPIPALSSWVLYLSGPGRYRTQDDNRDKQVCYFNEARDDEFYNVFISERINSESFDKGIYFQITPHPVFPTANIFPLNWES